MAIGYWFELSQCDPRAVGLYSRHYSSAKNGKTIRDWLQYGIGGPGQHMILLTTDGLALFGWIKNLHRKDGQKGVNCFVFRNEGASLSSALIKEACELAWSRWHSERLWTYVNPSKIASPNPGYCFKKAGWRFAGLSKGGLHILEAPAAPGDAKANMEARRDA